MNMKPSVVYLYWINLIFPNHLIAFARQIEQISSLKSFNFQNITLNVIAAYDENTQLEVKIIQDENGKVMFRSGFAISVLNDLSTLFNFSYQALKGDWVGQFPNGTYKGISYHSLQNGTADLQISFTTMLPYRQKVLNYLQPTYYGGIKAFFNQPPASTIRDVYIAPFSLQLWIVTFCSFFVIMSSLSLFSWVTNEFAFRNESLICTICLYCQQGCWLLPTSFSFGLLIIAGALTGLLIFISYSAAIVSTLSFEVLPINTFDQLLSSSLIIYVDEDSSTLKHLSQNVKGSMSTSNTARGLNFLTQRCLGKQSLPNAFIGFSHHFYGMALRKEIGTVCLCKTISSVDVNKSPYQHGILVPKNSIYKPYLNYGIIKLKEWGLNHRYMQQYILGTSTKCLRNQGIQRRVRAELGIYDLFTAFAILIFGFLVGLLAFMIETILHYKLNFNLGRKV